MIEMIDSGLEFIVLCYISDSNAVSSYLPNVEAIGPPYRMNQRGAGRRLRPPRALADPQPARKFHLKDKKTRTDLSAAIKTSTSIANPDNDNTHR